MDITVTCLSVIKAFVSVFMHFVLFKWVFFHPPTRCRSSLGNVVQYYDNDEVAKYFTALLLKMKTPKCRQPSNKLWRLVRNRLSLQDVIYDTNEWSWRRNMFPLMACKKNEAAGLNIWRKTFSFVKKTAVFNSSCCYRSMGNRCKCCHLLVHIWCFSFEQLSGFKAS